jgi:hypothetical protein
MIFAATDVIGVRLGMVSRVALDIGGIPAQRVWCAGNGASLRSFACIVYEKKCCFGWDKIEIILDERESMS